jgi:hypothetical protein
MGGWVDGWMDGWMDGWIWIGILHHTTSGANWTRKSRGNPTRGLQDDTRGPQAVSRAPFLSMGILEDQGPVSLRRLGGKLAPIMV